MVYARDIFSRFWNKTNFGAAASSPRPTQLQQAAIHVGVAWTRSNIGFNSSNVGACEPHPARVIKRHVYSDDRAQRDRQHPLTQTNSNKQQQQTNNNNDNDDTNNNNKNNNNNNNNHNNNNNKKQQ